MRHSRARLLPTMLATLALGFAAISFVAAWRHSGSFRQPVGPAPRSFGYPIENLEVTTDDEITLRGWYIPSLQERTAIVLLHGRGGTRESMLDRAEFLRPAGFGCLLYDARAHGESAGSICGLGALETRDLRAIVGYLRRRGVDRIGCLGFSQGAATILLAAPDLPQIQAVVVEASFPTLRVEIDHAFRRRIGLPGWLAGALYIPFTEWRLGMDIDEAQPIEDIARLSCPVLVAGGSLDCSAYPSDTQALYEAAHPPKQLWIVDGATHEDLLRFAPQEYQARVRRFFEDALGAP